MGSMPDPTETNPDKYSVVFENERVRVLEYRDEPGAHTIPHDHPDSVMITLSGFDRRLVGAGGESRDVTLEPAQVRWLDAQTHSGENIGETPTHVVFIELKEEAPGRRDGSLGPVDH
jgi:hypothetical protein